MVTENNHSHTTTGYNLSKSLNKFIMLLEMLRYLTLWLNRLSMLLGFIIGMGYTYLAMHGPVGLLGGLLTAAANLMLMWITSDNALDHKTSYKQYTNIYMLIGILALLLSSFSVFIHTYYSVILLAPLLPMPFAVIFGLGILIATCCTLSTLLFSSCQLLRPFYEMPTWTQQKILTFSNITSVLHTLVTLGHIWALQGNLSTFGIGVILSLCDLVVLCLFNFHLLTPIAPNDASTPARSSGWDTVQRGAYIGLSVTCILGSKIGSCIVYYQGTMLLGLALGLPFMWVVALAGITAAVATFAGLLFSAVQAYDLYGRFFPAAQASIIIESAHLTVSPC